MKRLFLNNVLFRLLWPLGYGVFIYLFVLLLNNTLDQLKESFFGQELYFIIALSYIVFEGNRLAVNWYFGGKKARDTLSLITTILLNAVVTGLVVMAVVSFYFIVVLGFSSLSTFSTEMTVFTVVYVVSSLLFNGLAVSNQFLFIENQSLLENEETLAANLDAELTRFKNEVNPHLLYDSLESLITLVHKSSQEAEDFIDQMALVYRHILSNRNNELIELTKEMDAVDSVVYILNEKYNQHIHVTCDWSSGLDDNVVIPGTITSTVQHIIESTIVSEIHPLEIRIEQEEKGYLSIRHRLNERLRKPERNYVQELQNAYSIFSEKPVVSVKAYGESFVKIPMLQFEDAA